MTRQTGSANKIRSQLTKQNFYLAAKYLGVSVGMYALVFAMMYAFVDVVGISKLTSYVLTYIFAYVLDYLINLRYLFQRDHSWPTVFKYISHILFFLGCGSIVFKLLISLNVQYLAATLLTAIVLMPLRFFAHKLIVFK